MYSVSQKICTESEYFALKVRIFVHAEFLSTKILNLIANFLNNSLCVAFIICNSFSRRHFTVNSSNHVRNATNFLKCIHPVRGMKLDHS